MEEKRKWLIRSLVLILIGIAFIGIIYLNQLNKATENMAKENMEELADHDSEHISSILEDHFKILDRISNRIQKSGAHTLKEIGEQLAVEKECNVYTNLFLIDDKGKTYDGTGRITDRADQRPIKDLLQGKEYVAFNFKHLEENLPEKKREELLVGRCIERFTVEGKTFVGVVGFLELKYFEKRLKMNCFGGAGRIMVIDKEGYYVVNADRSGDNRKRDNYFRDLQEKCEVSDRHIRKIWEKIQEESEFYDKLDCALPEELASYYHKVENTDWFMVITVPKSVVVKPGNYFILMSGMLLFVVICILIAASALVIYFSLELVRTKATSKAHSEFLSIMSHEIRTPLNGLIGLNYLMRNNQKDEEKMQEYLRKSNSTAQYLLSLINDILDMSKIQAGKMEIDERPFSLTYELSMIESMIRGKMEAKNIHFTIEKHIDADIIVGDATRINQILVNILGNAAKFTDIEGHISLQIEQKKLRKKEVETIYRVTDDGCGMTKEFQEHIFDSFTQEKIQMRMEQKGTGLGMPISRLLAEQMGGTLEVCSRLNEGSRFTFTLKSEVSDTVPDTVVLTDTVEEGEREGRMLRILLAEDQDLNAEILMELLEEEGFQVTRASDGEEVVEIFEQSEPGTYDVILMDVQMPKQNGYEATKSIRALNRADAESILIYACTANAFKEDCEMALQSGMNDFITKPINVEKLMRKLAREFDGEDTLSGERKHKDGGR